MRMMDQVNPFIILIYCIIINPYIKISVTLAETFFASSVKLDARQNQEKRDLGPFNHRLHHLIFENFILLPIPMS